MSGCARLRDLAPVLALLLTLLLAAAAPAAAHGGRDRDLRRPRQRRRRDDRRGRRRAVDDANPCTRDRCLGSAGCVPSDIELLPCGDDGDPCDGEDVCRSGACTADDTSVSVVPLVPLPGVTELGGPSQFRARDIADNDYAPRFFTAPGDPDYAASDYGLASMTVTYRRSGDFFHGLLRRRLTWPGTIRHGRITGPSATGKHTPRLRSQRTPTD